LFVVLFVEEGYAEVVEVEADDGGQAAEPISVAVEVVEQEDGIVAYMPQSLVGRLGKEAHTHLPFRPFGQDVGSPASTLQIASFPTGPGGQDDGSGLKVIGEAQEQVKPPSPPQTQGEGQLPVQLSIGIVGMTLTDDIRDEAEGEGTVHAVALAMAETGQPDERIRDFLHNASTKIRIIFVTFKQARQNLSLFSCLCRKISVISPRM
jgi:hypothetical protein